MRSINRREVILTASRIFGFAAVSGVYACSPSLSRDTYLKAAPKTVKDMHTHDESSRGFQGDVLKAKDIAKGEPVTLYITEGNPNRGGHRHPFTLNKEHFAKLVNGETVRITTEVASGHTHNMVIDPSFNPPGAESAEVDFDDNPETPIEESKNPLKVAIKGDDKPEIYISTSEEITDGSAEYCIGSQELCSTDQSLWSKMTRDERITGSKAFRIVEEINPSQETLLHLRAEKADGFMHRMIKFVRGD